MDFDDENNEIMPVDNSTSGFLTSCDEQFDRISGEYEQYVGKLRTVTPESINSLPSGFDMNDKYLDCFAKGSRLLVNLSELRDIYTAGNGISILSNVIYNTKETCWGDITGSLNDQNDLKNALDAIIEDADYNNYVPKTQTAELNQQGIVNIDTINQVKGMKTGTISENAEVLTDIKSYAHSTFDLSKFTKVGNPIVTEDGIASGFSGSNYIRKSITVNSSNYVIEGSFNISANTNDTYSIFHAMDSRIDIYKISLALRFLNSELLLISNDGTNQLTQSYAFSTFNRDVKYKIVVTSNEINLYINGVYATKISNNNIKTSMDTIFIGAGVYGWGPFLQGYTDLKQFSITADGIPVFSGNKTGIDTIKPDNYTVVGSPTISADGIASGFSDGNCLKTSSIDLSKPCKFVCTATTTDTLQNGFIIGRSTITGAGVAFGFGGNNAFRVLLIVSDDTTLISENNYSSLQTIQSNTKYTLTYEWTGTQHIFRAYDNNSSKVFEKIVDSSLAPQSGGISIGNTLSRYWPFNGSIDLNAFKIYVDGDLVYQPCLKIPYTESKTGSKIVDSIYRERVNDMAEQFGYAPYYTLSESDFTLPMGEIYGMIGKNRSYINALEERKIGIPILTLSNNLSNDEIWLEGAEVSKTTYAELYSIYGDVYGTPVTSGKFVLPDFRDRAVWGANTFGYISAGLPNITGSTNFSLISNGFLGTYTNGAITETLVDGNVQYASSFLLDTLTFDASNSSPIYGNSTTVQPPAIKVRVKTKYK